MCPKCNHRCPYKSEAEGDGTIEEEGRDVSSEAGEEGREMRRRKELDSP